MYLSSDLDQDSSYEDEDQVFKDNRLFYARFQAYCNLDMINDNNSKLNDLSSNELAITRFVLALSQFLFLRTVLLPLLDNHLVLPWR